jgi:hypothetical protein
MDFCSRQPSHDGDRISILHEENYNKHFTAFYAIVNCLISKMFFLVGGGGISLTYMAKLPRNKWLNQRFMKLVFVASLLSIKE